ncbi:MAG: hypothetical protein AUK44_03710 [Porphyromonadaceae bacterium CG2_30_38_12]|nr:MAG: hypothetical protein AUK44_03710 [Porphyromonadaceae bacterium CG2_30_38_12]
MKNTQILASMLAVASIFLSCEDKPVVLPPYVPPTGGSFAHLKTYYVATTGDDSRSPEQAKNPASPWKTIQKAASSVTGGDTVIIGGGTYYEKVTIASTCNGTAMKPTIFRNKKGETPIINGTEVDVRWVSNLKINSAKFITIQGIRFQNASWYGISAENTCSDIKIDSCTTYNTGASGIYVNGCTNLSITRNDVQKACQVTTRETNGNGTQECITVTGSNNFVVSRNEVSNSTVSKAAGGEGIDVKGGSYNGEISYNYIHDIKPLGIYIDAGSGTSYNIRIFSNKVYRTEGVAIAGELGGHAKEIYFYNNIIKESLASGFVFNVGANSNIQGKYSNVYVVNNTFYNNATTSGFAGDLVSYNPNTASSNLVVKNNIFYNKNANSKFSIYYQLASQFVVASNLYFDFKPGNNNANSFTLTNLTAADVKTDPLFTDVSLNDYSLKSTSPAINKGVTITLPNSTDLMFTTDFNGKARGTSNWDMGAIEF